jgi:2-polyprenyl-6-methoxyphenol hydroxylase-like FAD-dependent oxidoreductase
VKPNVLIIGAGIAGLSTALALTRKGLPVRVFEQAEEFRPLGAGLSLWSNAMRCLRVLGIADRLVEAGSVVERLQFRKKNGQVLKDVPLGRLSEKLGGPTICVHRADLQGACQAIEDALALAQSLAEASGVAEGLKLYELRRIKRASRLMRQARRFGVLVQTENRLLCRLWETMTKWTPMPLVLRQLESQIGGSK